MEQMWTAQMMSFIHHARATLKFAKKIPGLHCGVFGVLSTLENMEISGNLLILENSGNLKYTPGILCIRCYFS